LRAIITSIDNGFFYLSANLPRLLVTNITGTMCATSLAVLALKIDDKRKGVSEMWKIVLAVFLVFHGLIHLGYFSPAPADPKYPFSLSKSWLVNAAGLDISAAHTLAVVLGLAAVGGFALTGLAAAGIIIPQAWWLPLTVVASAASLLMLVIFWNNMLVLGIVIDVVLLVAVLGFGWQPFNAI
jgi:hypothetical protein